MISVQLIMAQSLDGIISRSPDEFIDWTGSADKRKFVELTMEAGVVIMGSRTFDTIGMPLPRRKNIVLTRNSSRISKQDNLLFTSKEPQEILDELEEQGYQKVALIGGSQINTLFAVKNLIDEVILTIAPRIFGQGLSLFNLPLDLCLKFDSSEILEEDTLLLGYSVVK